MASRLCFALVILFFAATLIVAVHMRGANRRAFYTLRTCTVEQRRLQQELWRKQLQVEALTNPASVSQRLEQ